MVKMTEEPEDFEGKWPDPRERAAPARREEMAAFAAELKADPAKAQAFFQSAGILNEHGELTPQYGGPLQAETVAWRRLSGFNIIPPLYVYRDAPRDDEPDKWEPLYLHPPAAPVQQAEPVGYFQRDCDYFEQVEDVYQWDADVIPLYLHPPPAEVQDGFDFREECDRRAHVIARLMSEAQRLREAAKATLAAVGDAPWILGRNLDEVTKALNELRRALEGE